MRRIDRGIALKALGMCPYLARMRCQSAAAIGGGVCRFVLSRDFAKLFRYSDVLKNCRALLIPWNQWRPAFSACFRIAAALPATRRNIRLKFSMPSSHCDGSRSSRRPPDLGGIQGGPSGNYSRPSPNPDRRTSTSGQVSRRR